MDVVGHQPERQEATADRFAIDQRDQARTTTAGQVQGLCEVGEVAVDAQQFVAARQPLACGIDQHHDRALRMCSGAGQHGVGQHQGMVHAHFDLVGGADHRHFAVVGGCRSGQYRIVHRDCVATREQRVQQCSQWHAHGRLR
ncbi:hypothetical protein D3C72_1561260 [compost metagenome]